MNGEVDVTLFKGNCRVNCRRSETSLYNEELASMDIEVRFSFFATGRVIDAAGMGGGW